VRVGARRASERAGDGPLVVVGYSNGGALALDYALDAVQEPELRRPGRLVLLSPMIGVHVAARLAPWIRRLGAIPYFRRSRWIDVLPEYIPFKYSSFPARAAEQGLLLSTRVRDRLAAHDEREGKLPPVLVFQSLVDSTVSTAAVADGLFAHLDGDDELVLFDVNRLADVRAFLPPGSEALRDRLAIAPGRRWRLTLVTNRDPQSTAVLARTLAPGAPPREHLLPLAWPEGTFSLSHVALPFPVDDPLWGIAPAAGSDEAVPRLGRLEPRGETGILAVPVETLMRLGCNPFFPYLAARTRAWVAPAPRPP
jgi:alpha-beta hydrolase superfamily lysophospholipase